MHLHIQKTTSLSGTITPPASKSQNIRAILFSALAKGKSILENTLVADDISDAINMIQALGVEVETHIDHMIINSHGAPFNTDTSTFYSGNSGLTTIFSLPLLGLRKHADIPVTFDCGEQMRARPIQPIVDVLNKLGMHIEYLKEPGKCPLKVSGNLLGGKTTVDGLNSQYLSALLMSLPYAPQDSQIKVNDLHERSYVDMTCRWLDKQNISYIHETHPHQDVFLIKGGQTYQPFETMIPGDFSSASCLIAASVLLPGKKIFKGLDMEEPQSDKSLIPLLQKMGADIAWENEQLVVHGGKPLHGIDIDANDFPDLTPALAVIGTQALGKTHIYHVEHARIKETDRIHSMTEGLTRLGAKIEAHQDGMTIWHSSLTGNTVKGFGDHRTVMSLSIAGLLAENTTIIDTAESIHKTFPNFVDVMKSLGASMVLSHHE